LRADGSAASPPCAASAGAVPLALLKRFRFTFIMLLAIVVGGGWGLHVLFARAGQPMGLAKSMVAAYFLMFAQPTVDIPDDAAVQLLVVLIPPLGLTTVAEGLIRFAVLLFSKTRNDKEWATVLAHTLKDHVIVCGAGASDSASSSGCTASAYRW